MIEPFKVGERVLNGAREDECEVLAIDRPHDDAISSEVHIGRYTIRRLRDGMTFANMPGYTMRRVV